MLTTHFAHEFLATVTDIMPPTKQHKQDQTKTTSSSGNQGRQQACKEGAVAMHSSLMVNIAPQLGEGGGGGGGDEKGREGTNEIREN